MDTLQAAIVLFLVMDPLGNVPVFLAVLRQVPEARQRFVIWRESLIALGVMALFLAAGEPLMRLFGLSQSALGLAGGIILFLISLKMIFSGPAGFAAEEAHAGEPLVVPLAVPLVAGPSAVATLMLLAARPPSQPFGWWIALLAAWIASTVILLAAPWLGRVLGPRFLDATQRLLGMLLAAVAVQQVVDGLKVALRG